MHRFWLFPLLLAMVGAFLPLLTFCEGMVPIFISNIDKLSFGPGPLSDVLYYIWEQFVEFMKKTTSYSGPTGFAIGIGVAIFDWWRNRRHDRMGIYATAVLLPNLWWCLVYAGSLSLLNGLIFCAILRLINIFPQEEFLWFVPLGLTALLNLLAVLWGSIRSVTSEDVLTPTVLRSKLKRSSRLTG